MRPLPFSLSVSTAGKAVVEAKPIATPTIKYEIGLLLKDLMEWPSPKQKRKVIVRDAFHLYESRTYHARPDVEPLRAGRPGRAQVPDPKSRVSDQPSAPTTWYDGHSKTWRMMAHSTQERLCYRGTHGWKQPLCFVLISGRNNKKKSPGWLVSLVIGDYLAWFGEHLLG